MKHAKGVLLIGLVLSCLAAAPRVADSAVQVLFEDDFQKLDPGWGDPSELVSAKGGRLYVRPKLGTSQAVQHQGIVLDDATICVTVRFLQDEGRIQAGGLIFWAADYENYYVVDITPDGRYAVTRWTKGRWLYPVSYRKTDAIKKDYNQENEIRVTTRGNTATISINRLEVASIKGQPPKGGGTLGLYAESGPREQTVVEFSRLKATDIP
jgi:hypothetical protein